MKQLVSVGLIVLAASMTTGRTAYTEELIWTPRSGHTMAAFNDMLVVAGGLDAFGSGMFYNDVWISEDGREWTRATRSSTHFSARHLHTMAVFKDHVWVMGGQRSIEFLQDVWRSKDGNEWEPVTHAAPWTPRRGLASVVHDDSLYILGGEEFDGEHANDVWRTSDGASWELLTSAAAWPPRRRHAVVSFQDELWIIGGTSEYETYQDVWHSADGVQWTSASSPPFSLTGHRAEVFKNALYVFGGVDAHDRLSNQVYQTQDGSDWQEMNEEIPWRPRKDHASAVHNNRLWLAGGLAENKDEEQPEQNDVWLTRNGERWRAADQGLFSCLQCDSGCRDSDAKQWQHFLGDWLLLGISLLALMWFRR